MSHDRSGGGWSERGIGDEPLLTGHPFELDAADRYERLEVLGRGGMGEVVVARDRRLGREVALKRIVGPEQTAEFARRFAREAWVTARLEHPSIVPIYDAGVDDEGVFYTMRFIHGRSFGEALAEATDLAGRLGLLRHFLAACEAVAYAHSHDIIHRDLKPANIMVGAFGETQVVDWGLAGFANEAGARAFSVGLGTDGLSQPLALGTPGYMSPEQARGEATDARTDVWALGAILHEVASGQKLVDGKGLSPTSPELIAIVDKATAKDLAARYRDAGELAADLARFLDGRRVGAHVYSTLELARRLVRRVRVPLIVIASALIAAAVALALTFQRIGAERTRATVALDESRQTSAWALARQAVTELEHGAIAEAEVLAAHALARGESPDARGVVLAVRAAARPLSATAFDLPGCDRILAGTWRIALCADDDAVVVWELEPRRERWRRSIAHRRATLVTAVDGKQWVVIVTHTNEVVVLDAASGNLVHRRKVAISTGYADLLVGSGRGEHVAISEGRILNVLALRTAELVFSDRTCQGNGIAAIAPGTDRFALVCSDGELAMFDLKTLAITHGATIPAVAAVYPTAAALSTDATTLAIGGVRGDLVRVELATETAAQVHRIVDGRIDRVAFADRARIVVASERDGARIWDLDAAVELARLPISVGAYVSVEAEGLVAGGRRITRFALPSAMAPRVLAVPVGLSAIAITPDGALVAAARGDGVVSILARATGHVAGELRLGTAVVKSVDFSLDGERLAAALSTEFASPRIYRAGSWEPLPIDDARRPARRVVFTGEGELLGVHFDPPLSVWSVAGVRRTLDGPEIYDVSPTAANAALILLAVDGTIWRRDAAGLTKLTRAAGATALAAWPRAARVATSHATGIVIHELPGGTRTIADTASAITDLVVSPDERFLCAARTDGTISIWRLADDQLVATLRAHDKRVAQLAFARDGKLVSGGWDGRIVTWDLGALDTPAADLVRDAERAWAIDLTLVLR